MKRTETGIPLNTNAQLERWIQQRTGGRVRSLRVEQQDGRLIVYGHTGSYYVRQLVLAAVQAMLEAKPQEFSGQVDLAIDVGPGVSGWHRASTEPRIECLVS